MRYIPNSPEERDEMLAAVGLNSADELFRSIPKEVQLGRTLKVTDPLAESEVIAAMETMAAKNTAATQPSFLGAGVYSHFSPTIVDHLIQRSEFFTSYTPYQPEISQGTLQYIFEFQTLVCQLTGMEVANASMYDGSTAVPEAAMMAMRITRRDRILVSRTLHPEYREVLDTYARQQGMPVVEFGYDKDAGTLDVADLESKINGETAAVIIQSPNFFGVVENVKRAADLAHKHGALLIFIFTEAVSLGMLEPPRDADIVAGELQSFAIPPSYGGPYAGIIATKEKYIRQIPGRLVGETKDSNGNRAYCLTLSTREQHIRREKATSNICTNQALIALMALVFMTVYGKRGLRELAEQNLSKAHYLADKLPRRFSGAFFNEFVAQTNGHGGEEINEALLKKKIIGGLPLKRFYPELDGAMLLCATEMTRRQDMDTVAAAFEGGQA